MNVNFKLTLVTVAALLNSSCDSIGDRKQELAPGTTVTIEGDYLNPDGSPLAARSIQLRNYRYFAHIDYAAVAIGDIVDFMLMPLGMFNFGWWFFPYNHGRNVEHNTQKANYYINSLATDDKGHFSFKIKVDDFLKDSSGNINIQLVNTADAEKLYGKYAFVVKNNDTNLGVLQLCTLGPITISEGPADIRFSWTPPAQTVQKYSLSIGHQSDNALVWSHLLEGSETSLTLPKAVFSDYPVRVGIEAFYTYETDKKTSCLSPLVNFEVATKVSPLSTGAVATAPQMLFKMDSLTNGLFSDNAIFEGFGVTSIILDLKDQQLCSQIVIHNLKLAQAGKLKVWATAAWDDNFSEVELEPGDEVEKRFMLIDPTDPFTCRRLKFEFSSKVIDIQEISVL
jgi:hypothetical protein